MFTKRHVIKPIMSPMINSTTLHQKKKIAHLPTPILKLPPLSICNHTFVCILFFLPLMSHVPHIILTMTYVPSYNITVCLEDICFSF